MGLAPAELSEPEAREHLVDALLHLRGRPGEVLEAERHVVLHALGHQLVLRVLEQHADVAARAQTPLVRQQVVAADGGDLGPGRPLETAEQTCERRLAGAVGADHGDELARSHGEAEPGEGVDGRAGIRVPQPAHVEERRGRVLA